MSHRTTIDTEFGLELQKALEELHKLHGAGPFSLYLREDGDLDVESATPMIGPDAPGNRSLLAVLKQYRTPGTPVRIQRIEGRLVYVTTIDDSGISQMPALRMPDQEV